jgi:hypothetical protein
MLARSSREAEACEDAEHSSAASGEGEAATAYSIADFQTKFDDLLPRIMKKRSDVKKARFTMGDEVLNLNLDKSVDAIVFIRGQGQKSDRRQRPATFLHGLGRGPHI